MEKLPKLYLSSFIFGLILVLQSCSQKQISYKKSFTKEQKEELAESLLNSAGTDVYYQGTVGERMLIHEGMKYAPESGWGFRELGVPYLKRGFPKEAFKYYTKAVEYDGESWAGYMAYCWLYFYKDYKNTIKLANQCNAYTPNFVDYPQSTSVDYMRGISYLKLDSMDRAISYLTKHLNHELESVGPKYVEVMPYQTLGIAFMENENYIKADSVFQQGIKNNSNAAELHYFSALNLFKMKEYTKAKQALDLSEYWLGRGGKNNRPYVEEFYSIYQEDIDVWRSQLTPKVNLVDEAI